MLAERRDPAHEYYVAVLNDRVSQGVVLVASSQGGMNIEEVAAKDPNAIITTPIDFYTGLSKPQALEIAKKLGFKSKGAQDEAADIFINLYKIFKEKDATQIEINPMAETTDGHVLWRVHYSRIHQLLISQIFTVWMPNSGSMTTPSSAKKTSSRSVIFRKKSHQKWRHRNSTSILSSLTAALDV